MMGDDALLRVYSVLPKRLVQKDTSMQTHHPDPSVCDSNCQKAEANGPRAIQVFTLLQLLAATYTGLLLPVSPSPCLGMYLLLGVVEA